MLNGRRTPVPRNAISEMSIHASMADEPPMAT